MSSGRALDSSPWQSPIECILDIIKEIIKQPAVQGTFPACSVVATSVKIESRIRQFHDQKPRLRAYVSGDILLLERERERFKQTPLSLVLTLTKVISRVPGRMI